MIRKIKILGLQRSGTNWVEFLIRRNLDVDVYDDPTEPFFKHALPDESTIRMNDSRVKKTQVPKTFIQQNTDHLFIIVRKDLVKWLDSIQRNPADLQKKRPYLYENGKIDRQAALSLYADYYCFWRQLSHLDNLLFVDYKGILSDYSAFLDKLSKSYELQPHFGTWKNVYKVPHSKRFTENDKKRYL